MNEELDPTEKAWLQYDDSNGELIEVCLSRNGKDTSSNYITIDAIDALKFMTGASKMADYKVEADQDNNMILVMKQQKFYTKLFWNLCDALSENSPLVILYKDKHGFRFTLTREDPNIILYVTLKNDPNYLHNTISLSNIKTNEAGEHVVSFDFDEDYSIYVRYHAA